MREIELTADELIDKLMCLSETETVCILDSCGVRHLGSHLLLAGVRPVELFQISGKDPDATLSILDEKLSRTSAGIFTLSYDFGRRVQRIASRRPDEPLEPDVFVALFTSLIIHDYSSGKTFLAGATSDREQIVDLLSQPAIGRSPDASGPPSGARSNFTREDYLASVEAIREHIRHGDTYQTNLTQQFHSRLPSGLDAAAVFRRLRHDHPAPFSSFIKRPDSVVVSASPERFFRVGRDASIEASPIKGTRPRGKTPDEDNQLRVELESSAKDRAENTMIVDLMRNDLGRVCEFGSVTVEKLCDIEEHPTLFHLVSTVRGRLRAAVPFSEILRAVFPCGSITGAPKLSTMQIIDKIEPTQRGLSMGAIGTYVPPNWDLDPVAIEAIFDLSVAIRTIVIRDGEAVFNVGGGVVIDSDPEKEFDESLLKAKALLHALGAQPLD